MARETPKIGLSGLVFAKVLSDDVNGITYDTPFAIPGAVVATINPNSTVETDYADNGAFFAQNNRGNTELSLELVNLSEENKALLFGMARSAGVTVETDLDQSPYFAFGGKILMGGSDENGDAIYTYFWYAKGKFSIPETGGETKRDTITFGHDTLTAQFVKTQYIPNGQKSGTICTHLRTDDPAVASATVTNWFNAPVVQLSQSTSAVTVAATTSDGKLVLTGTKGSSENFTFAEASAKLGETIIVVDSSGDLVAGTLAFGGTSSAPTITFTKAETANDFAGVTVTSGLKDNYGVGVTPMTDTSLS